MVRRGLGMRPMPDPRSLPDDPMHPEPAPLTVEDPGHEFILYRRRRSDQARAQLAGQVEGRLGLRAGGLSLRDDRSALRTCAAS